MKGNEKYQALFSILNTKSSRRGRGPTSSTIERIAAAAEWKSCFFLSSFDGKTNESSLGRSEHKALLSRGKVRMAGPEGIDGGSYIVPCDPSDDIIRSVNSCNYNQYLGLLSSYGEDTVKHGHCPQAKKCDHKTQTVNSK
ncbi:hypothetical protein STAS_23105 [Striga asiatica]|uniref:Uncharacterized protein n=1 Tax=Striga asiatica TaxID=4170 RepID=A0A5A7QNU3_STRAF|nr:hypothetical protein STAS_23105 [Striga asiatica]